jgi:hypothetical protein
MALLSQQAALTVALGIVADLYEDTPCDLEAHGFCTAHHWTGTKPCPQLRAKHLLSALRDQGAPVPPYTGMALDAMLRGCTTGQAVHVRVVANGYTHIGALGRHDHIDTAVARRFYVDVCHGERIEQVHPDDILEADVAAHPLPGAPDTPEHDPKQAP